MTSDVLKIPIGLPTLKNLAIDHVARITCTLDQRLGSDQMPGQLRHEIEVCKQEIIGGECVSKCHQWPTTKEEEEIRKKIKNMCD